MSKATVAVRNTTSALSEAEVQKFKAGLHGKLVRPGDDGYEIGRKVWNGMIDRHPLLIVHCAAVDDVINAVNFARDHDLLVAIRGGGHNVAGFGTCDDGMVIDLSPMKEVEIDVASHSVRAQAGLTWGEFDEATQAHGLATTGGLVSTTGIAGFTLGGGIGWLMRKYGLACDNLESVELVTAGGKVLTANAHEHPDLFWGVRGGGGNFGIITSFKYRLHPVGPMVYGGAAFYPIEKALDLLRFYYEWTATLPDELTTLAAFLTAPPEPFVPQHLQGTLMIAIALCYLGPVEQGEAAIKPLRDFAPPAIDVVGPIPYIALQGMFDASAPHGILSYWKTHYLGGLGDGAINTLIEHASKLPTLSPFTVIHIHHVAGAVRRVDQDETAFGHRDAPFVLNIVGMWNEANQTETHIVWVREFWQAMQPFSTGDLYLNFLGDEGPERVKAAYGAGKYEQLATLKNKYDPANFFRLNQNIKPTV
jgi:hypothetical protein